MYMRIEDDFEIIATSRPCSACGGDPKRCNGACNGSVSITSRPRTPEEIAAIRAARVLEEEERILREADAIRARRAVAT